MRESGTSLLPGLAPVGDPRIGPAAILVWAGIAPAAVLVLARLLGGAVALCGVLLVAAPARSRGKHAPLAAWLLAAAPLWVEAGLDADPLLFVGLGFFLWARGNLPSTPRVILLGWSLGWRPWAWVTLLPLAVGDFLRRDQSSGRTAAVILLSLISLWLLNPPALMDPGGWARAMLHVGSIERVGKLVLPPGHGPEVATSHGLVA